MNRMDRYIYKICARPQWQAAKQAGVFTGAEIDIKDGYIHFSSQSQIAETLALHFTSQPDVLLIEVDSEPLEIKWEPSRGGQLFPHLYASLPMQAVSAVWPLELDANGIHILPAFSAQ
ncbi:MAG: DUF952 domain-containing protein [Candidatus Puniceispirillaceae bacterium]